jgi:hypothetical protein
MKKTFEEPKMDVLRFTMKERITWNETGNEGFDFGTMTSEGVEEW